VTCGAAVQRALSQRGIEDPPADGDGPPRDRAVRRAPHGIADDERLPTTGTEAVGLEVGQGPRNVEWSCGADIVACYFDRRLRAFEEDVQRQNVSLIECSEQNTRYIIASAIHE
jgi:hypothetical protein